MLKKPKMVKTETNNYEIRRNIDNRHSEIPFSANNQTKTKFNYLISNQSSYGDRFIPRRRLSRNDENNKKFYAENEDIQDLLIWDLPDKYWLQNSMVKILERTFHISEKRILQFADERNVGDMMRAKSAAAVAPNNDAQTYTANAKNWICKARRKPFAYSESTHDSVGFSDCFERNMMDWSVNGQVVASFADDVIIWRTIRDTSVTFHVENTSCLAYGPNGRYLAIGCRVATYPVIELWDISKYGVKVKVVWRYFFKTKKLKIQCFEWSQCGKFLIAGTNKGVIYVLSVPKMKIVQRIRISKYAVNTIRFSTAMRYLAAADTAGNIVIYNWSNHKLSIYLQVFWKRKTRIMLDWHPWNGVYELAIADSNPAFVVLINVPSKKITSFYRRKDRSIEIDALAFNKITAELCLGISKEEGLDGFSESKILVLESLNRIVDILEIENGARFLMFDPDGTRLVTAGNDDSLTIWRFYPDTHKKCGNHAIPLNSEVKQKLFYGCDRGAKFQLWSNLR